MSQNSSIIDHPKFSKWVRNFDFNDPEFLKDVKERNRISKSYILNLESKAKRIDRKTNWHVPVRKRERS